MLWGPRKKKKLHSYEEIIQKKEPGASASEEQLTEYEVLEMEIRPQKIICPDCGGVTLEGLDFCDKCAGEL